MLRSYCLTLLASSVLGGLCASLADRPFARYLRYLTALLCILPVIAPFRNIDVPSFFPETTPAETAAAPRSEPVETETLALLESWFADELFSDTGIKAASVRIQIDWDADSPTIHSLAVTLETPTDENKLQTERWAADRFGIPCAVE